MKIILKYILYFIIIISAMSTQCQSQKAYRGINTWLINNYTAPHIENYYISEEYFKNFKDWNINIVRVLFKLDPAYIGKNKEFVNTVPSNSDFDTKLYEKNFQLLDTALKYAEKYNIKIVVYTNKLIRGGKTDVFYNKTTRSGYYFELLNIYKVIAEKYKDNDFLFAYDPLSEPKRKIEDQIWKEYLFEDFYEKIIDIDSAHFILFAPGPVGKVDGYNDLVAFDLSKVMYSVHGYYPSGYTHQGIKRFVKDKAGEIEYPGHLQENWNTGVDYWNKERLQKAYQPVIDFVNKYNVEVFIGEFGVVRWAPNPEVWLNDVISFYEEYGFNWTYFSYGGMNRWNPTFKPNDPVSYNTIGNYNSELIKNLKRYWSNNELLPQKKRDTKLKPNSNIDN